MKKILFVEDNALISSIYSCKLGEAGFEVVVAEDGLEAIKQLPLFMPDLVVLDLLMPKLTGADVLKFIRQHPELKSVRVIVFSNSFLSNLVEQIAAMEVQRTLVKAAVTPARLIDVIHQVFEEPGASVAVPPKPGKTPVPVAQAAKPGRAASTSAGKSAPEKKVEPPVQRDRASAPVTAKTEPARAQEEEPEHFARVGRQFMERVPVIFSEIRQLCREFLEAAEAPTQAERLAALNRKLSFLTQVAGMAGSQRTAELSSALEALLFEMVQKPAAITDSSRQTVATAIAFLAEHFDEFGQSAGEPERSPTILVVDDDAVSNRALVLALERAKLSATSVADPLKALAKLGQQPYDVVLLDIEMPGMDGLALCEKMRGLPNHKRTPVIFVTSHTDYKTRAKSMLSGGNDLIAKPISPTELCVKVMVQLLRADDR